MGLKVPQLSLSVAAECPKSMLGKDQGSVIWVGLVLSRVGKGVQTLKLLDFAAPVPRDKGTDQRAQPCPQVWATHNAIYKPAVPARVRFAKLVLDEGVLPTAFLAAKEKVLLRRAVGSHELPSFGHTVFGGIAPPFAVVHGDQYCTDGRIRQMSRGFVSVDDDEVTCRAFEQRS
jgi:hypothetical protein